MTFILPGFDHWTFQVVMVGSLLVLEALRDDLRLSTELEPMDSTSLRANDLMSHPSCALACAHC
ncbi:MAG: hypothetical protein RLZZ516_1081 [Cyanobacteriota bacterium]